MTIALPDHQINVKKLLFYKAMVPKYYVYKYFNCMIFFRNVLLTTPYNNKVLIWTNSKQFMTDKYHNFWTTKKISYLHYQKRPFL